MLLQYARFQNQNNVPMNSSQFARTIQFSSDYLFHKVVLSMMLSSFLSFFFLFLYVRITFSSLSFPGHSIRPSDTPGPREIRYRNAAEVAGNTDKTGRIRSSFHRNPN